MYMYTVCVQVYIHFHNATRLTSTLLKKKCLSLLNNNNTEEIQVPKIKLTIILLRCSRCNDIDHNFKFFDASFLIVDPHWFFFFFLALILLTLLLDLTPSHLIIREHIYLRHCKQRASIVIKVSSFVT